MQPEGMTHSLPTEKPEVKIPSQSDEKLTEPTQPTSADKTSVPENSEFTEANKNAQQSEKPTE